MNNANDQPAWHELLDALALERGHRDNLALAQALCDLNGNSSQAAFDTAVKNLRNWRAGHHVPQRRNFLLLSHLLDVDGLEPERVEGWKAAYRQARQTREETEPVPADRPQAGETAGNGERPEPAPAAEPGSVEPDAAPSAPVSVGQRRPRRERLLFATGLLSGILAGVMAGLVIGTVFVPQSIRLAFDLPPNFAGTHGVPQPSVVLRRGESMLIGSVATPDCGQEPPSWESVAASLPELSSGVLSDGGPGNRYEPECGMRVGARGVMFSAQNRGVEHFLLAGSPLRIRVY